MTKGETVAPTFDEEGYTVYACDVCHATYHKDNSSRLVAVAKVGDTRYQTLAEAIAAAGNDGVVTLLADGETKLVEGQTLKVVLNGFALVVTTDVDGKVVNSNTDTEGVTTYVLADKHVHEFNIKKYNENVHWMECTCGEKQPAVAHNFSEKITQPTCTEGGYTTYTCVDCEYHYTTNETEAKGHQGIETAEVAASYATTGTKAYYTCGVCGKTFADEGCTIEIENLEEWKLADGVIKAQKDDSTFENSEEAPFTIANAADYKAIADACNGGNKYAGKYIKLLANIGSEEEPIKARIGNSATNYFGGIFDGNGKTVYLNISLNEHVGMFGVADHGAIIKNITVNGSVSSAAAKDKGLGGIVGSVIAKGDATIALTIENCTNNATISHTATNLIAIGGVVGRFQTTGSVIGCTNNGKINAASNSYIGGIVGYASNTLTITNCNNTADIIITEATAVIGGILGMTSTSNANAIIKGCVVSDCELNGKGSVGGIVGRIYQGKVSYVNWTDDSVKNVTFVKNGETLEPIAGIDNTGRTESATAAPGIMFGSCKTTATMVTE